MKRVSVLIAAAALAMSTAPAAAAADLDSFISPSGNIGCIIYEGHLRCDIAQRDWSPPPRPADCPSFTGYGQGIGMEAHGPASFVCAGDTALNMGPALDYGQTHSSDGFVCTSEPTGLRCTNADGHGFGLSRQAYDLF